MDRRGVQRHAVDGDFVGPPARELTRQAAVVHHVPRQRRRRGPGAAPRVHRLAVDIEGRRSAVNRERDVVPAVAQLAVASAGHERGPADAVRDLPPLS